MSGTASRLFAKLDVAGNGWIDTSCAERLNKALENMGVDDDELRAEQIAYFNEQIESCANQRMNLTEFSSACEDIGLPQMEARLADKSRRMSMKTASTSSVSAAAVPMSPSASSSASSSSSSQARQTPSKTVANEQDALYLSTELNKLRALLDKTRKDLGDAQAAAAVHDAELAELRAQVKKASEMSVSSDPEVLSSKSRDELVAMVVSLRKNAEEAMHGRKETGSLRLRLRQMQALVASQNAELLMKNELPEDVEVMQRDRRFLQDSLRICQNDLHKSQEENKSLQKEHAILMQRTRDETAAMAQKVSQANAEVASLRQALDRATATLRTVGENAAAAAAAPAAVAAAAPAVDTTALQEKLQAAERQAEQLQTKEIAARQHLAIAMSEVARLSKALDDLRAQDVARKETVQTLETQLMRLQQGELATAYNNQLQELLRENTSRLKAAMDTIALMQMQSCVQVSVKKEVLHTRLRQEDGRSVTVNKSEEVDVVTWFTEGEQQELNTAPFMPEEDRALLQAQMTLGNDWMEIARLMPGRSDRALAKRWSDLTQTYDSRGNGTARTESIAERRAVYNTAAASSRFSKDSSRENSFNARLAKPGNQGGDSGAGVSSIYEDVAVGVKMPLPKPAVQSQYEVPVTKTQDGVAAFARDRRSIVAQRFKEQQI
eukprot:m.169481 g.169481  ORF g.169481 m.169481 type:complete len:666 (-) comp17241_c0_seq5:2380-4377(-)